MILETEQIVDITKIYESFLNIPIREKLASDFITLCFSSSQSKSLMSDPSQRTFDETK